LYIQQISMLKKNLLGLFVLHYCNVCLAQDTTNSKKYLITAKTWQDVQVKSMSDSSFKSFCVQGENGITIHHKIKKLSDISKRNIEKIKKEAAHYNCPIAFVDIDKIFDDSDLYFCYGAYCYPAKTNPK